MQGIRLEVGISPGELLTSPIHIFFVCVFFSDSSKESLDLVSSPFVVIQASHLIDVTVK